MGYFATLKIMFSHSNDGGRYSHIKTKQNKAKDIQTRHKLHDYNYNKIYEYVYDVHIHINAFLKENILEYYHFCVV